MRHSILFRSIVHVLIVWMLAAFVLPPALGQNVGDAVRGSAETSQGATPPSLDPLDAPFGNITGISGLMSAVFRFGIIMIIIAAAIFIAIGAYMYFIAAGNAEMAKTGRTYIERAIIGLVIGLFAWVILNTINPELVNLREPGPPPAANTR